MQVINRVVWRRVPDWVACLPGGGWISSVGLSWAANLRPPNGVALCIANTTVPSWSRSGNRIPYFIHQRGPGDVSPKIFPATPSATFSIIGCLVLFLTVPRLNFQWFDLVCHTLPGWVNPHPRSVPEPDFQIFWASNGGAWIPTLTVQPCT